MDKRLSTAHGGTYFAHHIHPSDCGDMVDTNRIDHANRSAIAE
ncbi:hypothetical protein [Spirosoma oryzicola]|nr:hypothetical protein [Spirosoma oryzicola]